MRLVTASPLSLPVQQYMRSFTAWNQDELLKTLLLASSIRAQASAALTTEQSAKADNA